MLKYYIYKSFSRSMERSIGIFITEEHGVQIICEIILLIDRELSQYNLPIFCKISVGNRMSSYSYSHRVKGGKLDSSRFRIGTTSQGRCAIFSCVDQFLSC